MLDLAIVSQGDDCGTVLVVNEPSDELFRTDTQERKVVSIPIICGDFALRIEPHICLFRDLLSVLVVLKRHQIARIQAKTTMG
jgi:hypothetical protein